MINFNNLINESKQLLSFNDGIQFDKSNTSINKSYKKTMDKFYGFNQAKIGDILYYDNKLGYNLVEGEYIGTCYIEKTSLNNAIYVKTDIDIHGTFYEVSEKIKQLNEKYPKLNFNIPSKDELKTALINGLDDLIVDSTYKYWTNTEYNRAQNDVYIMEVTNNVYVNSSFDVRTKVEVINGKRYLTCPSYMLLKYVALPFFTINEDNDQLLESWERNKDVFVPTVKQMREWFNEFNNRFFNNQLPMIDLQVGDCGRSVWGHFYCVRRFWKKSRKWEDPFDPKKCHIRLSDRFAGTLYNLKNTMIHEMVHYYIAFHYDYDPTRVHGKEFLYEAEKINRNSEWHITPTSDYVDNEISDKGIQRIKNRIKDEYIVCIFKSIDKYGIYHMSKTEEKYVERSCKTLMSWNCEYKWYKIKVKNPRFGNAITNRGTTFNYVISGDSIDDVFNKFDDKYGLIDKEEFYPEIDMSCKNPLYIITMVEKNGQSCFAAKLEDKSVAKKIKDKYEYSYDFALFKINYYDKKLIMADVTTKGFKTILYGKEPISFIDELLKKYNLDIDNIEEIKI